METPIDVPCVCSTYTVVSLGFSPSVVVQVSAMVKFRQRIRFLDYGFSSLTSKVSLAGLKPPHSGTDIFRDTF